MNCNRATTRLSRRRLERLFSAERLGAYVEHCGGNFPAAVRLYEWNAALSAAFWEPIGHLEVAMRNAMSGRLAARHLRLGRTDTWLDDPHNELTRRARHVIGLARTRVRQRGKTASDAQTISELSFGFWRFLITRRMTGFWPDLAVAFPHAPDRRRETVEEPITRLHDFRNRLAHHQRIWSRSPGARYEDLMRVAGYIDPDLPAWIDASSAVPTLLRTYRPCGGFRRPVRVPLREWAPVDVRLKRLGGRRMSPAEFEEHFGGLPTDGKG